MLYNIRVEFMVFNFFILSIIAVFISFISYFYFRHKYILLTQAICNALDDVILGKHSIQNMDLETQSSKIRSKLDAIVKMTICAREQNALQKQELQQMISDISHQLKTPISNILMYSDTLEASQTLKEEEHKFLLIIQSQVKKLEFLIQSLIKMSRLESHMLIIKQEITPVFPVISKAVSSVLFNADKKNLRLEVSCPQDLCIFFDPKWTEEAIFNVLDNAVKYTSFGGGIFIKVEQWQLYTRIQIEDTGQGIYPEHQNDIFKRFYRESRVHKESGVGLGLYLTREILERQGGYIIVSSCPEKGSCFSIFLPNKSKELS